MSRPGIEPLPGPLPLLGILLAVLLRVPAATAGWLKHSEGIMGTRIEVELYHEDDEIAQRGVREVMQEMRRIDRAMSPFIEDSELSRVNREAARHPVAVSEELFRLLQKAVAISALTHGAFDISFASVGFLYDYRTGTGPDDAQRRAAADRIDYRRIRLDPERHSIYFEKPGMRIDLGGIAKGYAVDRCIALLQDLGIGRALVRAGGDSRVIGDRWGRPWTIGVRDPRDPDGLVAVIPLMDVAVSTSGDYERFFERNGVRYHHIIDPGTGDSARQLRSATLIGPDATTTDALSTSVFVLGPERGMALIERLPGIDAIVVDAHGQLHYSSGLEAPGRAADSARASRQNPVPGVKVPAQTVAP
ncbi:MAG TPA: FAD:protein FMN transferase [Gammaproteobacteria bacterium]|nr:FAD:protein FMN transferase [Gammaproteobacteria bacterium]